MKKIYSKFEHETIAICTDLVSCADEAIASVADSIDLEEGTAIIEGFEHHIGDLVVVDETYSLWKFDVWGDADEWTVNDRHRIAEVAIEDIDDDSEIESILVEYGVASADEYIAFDGDDNVIFAYAEDGYPLCELVKNGF